MLLTKDLSKNNPCGIKKPKTHENPSRCFVRLFKVYNGKSLLDRPTYAFYFQPFKKPTDKCCVSQQDQFIGHLHSGGTVARMRKAAGISGYKTNHLLEHAHDYITLVSTNGENWSSQTWWGSKLQANRCWSVRKPLWHPCSEQEAKVWRYSTIDLELCWNTRFICQWSDAGDQPHP